MGGDTEVLEVPPRVLDYLRSRTTLTLATASPAGVPRAATLTYVSDGFTLYVWTRRDTTTARHIDQNPVVSFTIDEYAADWRQTKGIQGSGEARVLLDPQEIEQVVARFREKFPALAEEAPTNISFFRIAPTELQFIDSGSAGAEEAEQRLGFDFGSELVYGVFRDLPPEQVTTTIASKLHTSQVDAGTVVVRQGAPADKFFIIVDGEVEVLREDDGETRTIATLGRGQFFGEMAILRDMPRAATVRALSSTTLFTLDRDAFRSLVAQSLGTTERFDQVIKRRLDELSGTASS